MFRLLRRRNLFYFLQDIVVDEREEPAGQRREDKDLNEAEERAAESDCRPSDIETTLAFSASAISILLGLGVYKDTIHFYSGLKHGKIYKHVEIYSSIWN